MGDAGTMSVAASNNLTTTGVQAVTGAKTFNDQKLKLRNPLDTFTTTVVNPAITADRNLTIPDITANDTFVTTGIAQTITAAKTFNDQKLILRNPANTFSLTQRNPAITADADTRINQSYTYIIWIEGSTVYVKNGATGAIDFSGTGGTNGTTAIQAALTALASTGGLIHFCAGTFPIYQQLTIPQHNGKSIVIEGEGWFATTLQWGNTADASKYVIECYSTLSSGWQIVTFKDLQILGGLSATDRRVHALHLGREVGAANAHFQFYNVRVGHAVSAQIVAHYLQSSFFYNFYCESYGATPADYPIIDMAVDFSAHVHMMGSLVGAVTVNESRFEMFGGTLTNLEIQQCANYITTLDAVFMDPPSIDSTGFTHQIQVGTTGSVIGAVFDSLIFSSDTHTPATDRYIYVNNAKNVFIRNPSFATTSTVATFLELTSASSDCYVYWQNQIALSKITNAGTRNQIFNPYINNNLNINNPSGTSGATIIDSFTSNRIELANTSHSIYDSLKVNNSSGKIGWKSRNAANNADITRIRVGNIQDQGLSPIEALENIKFTGGVSIIPFVKAGTISDSDFLNPTSGLIALDTANNNLYARIGTVWTIIGSKSVSGGVPKSAGGWFGFGYNGSGNTVVYQGIWAHGAYLQNPTEGNVDLIFDYTFTVKRVRFTFSTNGRNGNTIISLRDDAADVTGTAITIAGAATGEFDSGALSVDVAAGSKVDWKIDPTAGSSGSLIGMGMVEYEILLQ